MSCNDCDEALLAACEGLPVLHLFSWWPPSVGGSATDTYAPVTVIVTVPGAVTTRSGVTDTCGPVTASVTVPGADATHRGATVPPTTITPCVSIVSVHVHVNELRSYALVVLPT